MFSFNIINKKSLQVVRLLIRKVYILVRGIYSKLKEKNINVT